MKMHYKSVSQRNSKSVCSKLTAEIQHLLCSQQTIYLSLTGSQKLSLLPRHSDHVKKCHHSAFSFQSLANSTSRLGVFPNTLSVGIKLFESCCVFPFLFVLRNRDFGVKKTKQKEIKIKPRLGQYSQNKKHIFMKLK